MNGTELATIVGIDLGTTYSCISYVDETGRPVVLKNSEGQNVTPSVVFFESSENVVVGRTAKNAMLTDPEKVVAFMKRCMGDANAGYSIEGTEYRPEEVSSFVLRRLVKDAGESLQKTITGAVITVPAYFGENERAATEQAGKIAGLNVRSIINEPTAAAICYGIDQAREGTVLVYDLGGGTFDVTMIKVQKDGINVICTGCDHELGGKGWDECLLNYFVSEWGEQAGQSDYEIPQEDRETENELRLLAEDTKEQLTARERLTVNVRIEGERARIEVTRDKFNELTESLLNRTIDLTRKMLDDARQKGVTDFDKILLVGGATKMPQVKDRLARELGKEILVFDPDEAVAKGAALFAYRFSVTDIVGDRVERRFEDPEAASPEEREEAQQEVIEELAPEIGMLPERLSDVVSTPITNVTSKAFGVVAVSDVNREEVVFLISRNQTLPIDTTMPFKTSKKDQDTADIRVMEGEDERATNPVDCIQIGRTTLGLPPGLEKDSRVDITFCMSDQGMLTATAREVKEGRTVDVKVERGESVMTDEEVQQSSQSLKKFDVS